VLKCCRRPRAPGNRARRMGHAGCLSWKIRSGGWLCRNRWGGSWCPDRSAPIRGDSPTCLTLLPANVYSIARRYYRWAGGMRSGDAMISDFKDKDTESVWTGKGSLKLPQDIQDRSRRKLRMLQASRELRDLRNPPSNHLEKLTGDREGQYSIRVNNQWRVCFKWDNGTASDVEIVDYH
jgi:toxin HigB-1